jgi:hypothetical protein
VARILPEFEPYLVRLEENKKKWKEKEMEFEAKRCIK